MNLETPTMSRLQRSIVSALCLLTACGGSSAEGIPGEETSSCNDGNCLAGLECRSELCVDPNLEPTGGPDDDGDGDGSETSGSPQPTEPSSELDVLFVVDNSGSMGEEQAGLSESIGSFVQPLIDGGLDVLVGVTTTDDSNYWCRGSGVSGPESGQLVYSSCQSRLGDFYFVGTDTNAETACTDFCSLDSVSGGPWLEVSDVSNAVSTLQCVLPQGINGCGFESTLESARKALLLADSDQSAQAGFVRDGAHLAVVFLTDEADCSFNSDLQDIVFGEEGVGNQEFWSLPGVQQSPSSAVCWNAGVDCNFALDSDQCTSANKDVDGNPTTDPDDAALYPLARFRSQLEALREDKLPAGAEVFVFGIVGVPENYPQLGVMSYTEGPDANSPESFQARFGIGQGCSSQVSEAVPPVRIRELVEDSAWGELGKLYSVCSTDYSPALADMASTIVGYAP